MPVKSETKKAVETLADLVVRSRSIPLADLNLAEGARSGPIPAALLGEEETSDSMILSGPEYAQFRKAIYWLRREPELEHLSDDDLDEGLWEFACRLALDPALEGQDSAPRGRTVELLAELMRPWVEYEVAIEIQDLHLASELNVGGTTLTKWTPDLAIQWSITKSPSDNILGRESLNTTVALARVMAGGERQALDRGRLLIDRALDLVRVGLVTSIYVRVHDQEVLFRRGERSAVRLIDTGACVLQTWSLGLRPFGTNVSDERAAQVIAKLAPLEGLLADKSRSTALRDRLARAVHWISVSMTRESFDDKVVDLCTALETLLAPKSDPRKGEALALRTMLLPTALADGFIDPVPSYYRYIRRSDVIHGSDLYVCDEHDYRELKWLAELMLDHAVRLLANEPTITRFGQLIEKIEDPVALENCHRWLREYGPRAEPIADYAAERIAAIAPPAGAPSDDPLA